MKALRSIATGNASEDNIKTMDDMIEKFNASSEAHKIERQSTVNIKRQTNSDGNNLVEFRAAGGPTVLRRLWTSSQGCYTLQCYY